MKKTRINADIRDSAINRQKILLNKFGIDIDQAGLWLSEVECSSEYDKSGNLLWQAVYTLNGGERYFRFWGEGSLMEDNAVEIFRKETTQTIITYEEKDDDTNRFEFN
jgi:hypothetical protein